MNVIDASLNTRHSLVYVTFLSPLVIACVLCNGCKKWGRWRWQIDAKQSNTLARGMWWAAQTSKWWNTCQTVRIHF